MSDKQLRLGELVELLQQIERDDQTRVEFDFCELTPGLLHSYRGYYEHLAIEPGTNPVLLDQFITDLDLAVGQEYEGWKGGRYTMNRDTPIWVAYRGHNHHTVITGAVKDYNTVILQTSYRERY
jgi:hypothetical protein